MSQHNDGPGDEDEEEVIRLARTYAELYYRHDLHIDIDALCAELRWRVPVAAPPPQTRFQQARVSIARAWRQVPWDWRAPIRSLSRIAVIIGFGAITVVIVLLLALCKPLLFHYFKPPTPGRLSAGQVVKA